MLLTTVNRFERFAVQKTARIPKGATRGHFFTYYPSIHPPCKTRSCYVGRLQTVSVCPCGLLAKLKLFRLLLVCINQVTHMFGQALFHTKMGKNRLNKLLLRSRKERFLNTWPSSNAQANWEE